VIMLGMGACIRGTDRLLFPPNLDRLPFSEGRILDV